MNWFLSAAFAFVAIGLDRRFVGDMGEAGPIIAIRIFYGLLSLAFLAYALPRKVRA